MPRFKLVRHSGVVADTTPDAFTLDDITDADLTATEVSNAITVAGLGLGISVTASVSGDASSQLQKNGTGTWLTSVSVTNGDTVAVRHTSSSSNSTAISTTLTIGGVSDTFTSTTVAAGGVVYDTAVGNGVDSAGFADLPLRSGAKRYFVNATTGSDTHTSTQAQDPATPVATLAKAKGFVVNGQGDQVLVAEGTTYGESIFRYFNDKSGFSQVYPTVLQSYDPADPLNEAKYGRASGSNRPVLTTTSNAQLVSGSGTSTSYVAMRGFDFNPGNVPGIIVQVLDRSIGTSDYFLFENNLFRYTMLGRTAVTTVTARGFIARNCSFYGQWKSVDDYSQGVYSRSTIGTTVEDCVFWHVGWKIGASRSDDISVGGLIGPSQNWTKNHPVYLQNDDRNTIYRRNLIIDCAADGGHVLGDALVSENVVIDCPIGLSLGGGTSYPAIRPDGVDLQINYNAILGSAAQDSDTPEAGFAIWVSNTSLGSSAHHNIIAQARVLDSSFSTAGALRLDNSQNSATTSCIDFHDNISFNWSASGSSTYVETTAGPVSATLTNNIWDDPSDGSGNVQATAGMFSSPYDVDGLITAAGYTGADAAARKQALIDYAIAHPEARPGRALANLMYAGYGLDHSVGV